MVDRREVNENKWFQLPLIWLMKLYGYEAFFTDNEVYMVDIFRGRND